MKVRIQGPEEGPWDLLAPAVGWWQDLPLRGAWLAPGADVGTLRTLNRRTTLYLPDSHAGRVDLVSTARVVAVGYGDVLLRLGPLATEAAVAARAASDAPHRGDLPDGTRALVAPTDGVFYRGPDPQSPPFVEVGEKIRSGQPIGLVEVMKTFNQIAYGGPGLPAEAEVMEIRCADGEEIARGDVLLVVR